MSDKQIEALKLALEALMRSRPSVDYCKTLESCAYGSNYSEHKLADKKKALTMLDEAITALREALADSALERMAKNERELGIDYMRPAEIPQSITCPFCESQHVPGWMHDYNMDRMKKPAPPPECKTDAEKTAFAFGWWKALEENRKQPAQQQEPVSWDRFMSVEKELQDMTAEFMRVAKELAALKTQQQEPLAWMYPDDHERMLTSETFCTVYSVEVGSPTRGETTIALYTSPPASKPLTDEQWQSIADTLGCIITRSQKDAIEATIGIKGDA